MRIYGGSTSKNFRRSAGSYSVRSRATVPRYGNTDPKRSELMRAVRQRGTSPELAVGAFLRNEGVRYRRNVRSLPGSPDFANRSRGFAVFVHGCFWHRHPGCKKASTPKRNSRFWREKFLQNVARDRRKEAQCRAVVMEVAVVWECESTDERKMRRALAAVLRKAKNNH